MEEKWVNHYSSSHQILLVGEGDFSFSACLAIKFGSAANMVATSLDSKESVVLRYSEASRNLQTLKELGCTILHQVDARTMSRCPILGRKTFDRIIFNFPHAGLPLGLREHNWTVIELHKQLVSGFLRSARDMVRGHGQVHVTHKTAQPFDRWEIESLAEAVGLRLIEKVEFVRWEYPGYINKKRLWKFMGCDISGCKHKELVHCFFANARVMLRAHGEIHVNHKTTPPFCCWNIEEIANRNCLALVETVEFKIEDYPGYSNKRGDGSRCDVPFPLGKCSTFKFRFCPSANKSEVKEHECSRTRKVMEAIEFLTSPSTHMRFMDMRFFVLDFVTLILI